MRSNAINSPLMDIAASIQRLTSPDELIIVRSDKPRRDALWQRRNNYETPAMFYQSRRHGWVLPADGFDVTSLERLRTRGARIIYNPLTGQTHKDVTRWLKQESDILIDQPGCQVYRLHT